MILTNKSNVLILDNTNRKSIIITFFSIVKDNYMLFSIIFLSLWTMLQAFALLYLLGFSGFLFFDVSFSIVLSISFFFMFLISSIIILFLFYYLLIIVLYIYFVIYIHKITFKSISSIKVADIVKFPIKFYNILKTNWIREIFQLFRYKVISRWNDTKKKIKKFITDKWLIIFIVIYILILTLSFMTTFLFNLIKTNVTTGNYNYTEEVYLRFLNYKYAFLQSWNKIVILPLSEIKKIYFIKN